MSLEPDLLHFVLTVAFSFLVGLEVKTYRIQFHADSVHYFFGSARTFTFVGILGFLFYRIDPERLVPYTAVLLALTLLFGIFYRKKVEQGRPSILLYAVLLCVYALGPMTQIYPLWMPALLFVLIVFILNARSTIHRFSHGINTYEFETLGKMVLLSAVILPLLPKENVIPYIPIAPFKIWLAVVVISAISYGGYIAQRYLFPSRGYFLMGVLGGIYSSTATTVVLARKAKETGASAMIDSAVVAATGMMYLRLVVVALFFSRQTATSLLLPFIILALAGFALSALFYGVGKRGSPAPPSSDPNPLELGTAFMFATLFVFMIVATDYITRHYGGGGLKLFAFVAGFTDIDPFVLSLLTGHFGVAGDTIVASIVIAAGSNNLLKALYALWFGGVKRMYRSAAAIALLGVVTIAWGVYFV